MDNLLETLLEDDVRPKNDLEDELYSPAAWRAAGAEFIATLLFVFLGAGSVVVTGGMLGEELTSARLGVIAVSHGLAIAFLVSATANISGGHINPAVTLAVCIAGKISPIRGGMYVIAQLAGAVIGAAFVAAVVPDSAHGNLGAHGLGSGVSVNAGLLAEVILTFCLVFVVFATAIDPAGLGRLAPIAIGLAVLVDHLFGVPVTGASMNPARSFGPALVAGAWQDHWIYWIGPAIGAGLAALFYQVFFLRAQDA